MEYENLITERYSVRDFKPEHLSSEVISKILEAAHKAPTGCNYQPQRILVLNNESSLEKLKKCTKCHFNAPTAMLVCYNEDESWKRVYDGALSAPVDAAIVATHDPSRMAKEFNIPKNIKPLALLVMGYPSDASEPLEMHNKFRKPEEIVIYDQF